MDFNTSSIAQSSELMLHSNNLPVEVITSRNQLPLKREKHTQDYGLTEIGISNFFGDMYIGKIKFNFDNKCWYLYSGKKWVIGKKNEIFETGKEFFQLIQNYPVFENSENRKWLSKNYTRSKISNVLKLASSKKSFATSSDEFDTKPELINCTNGTLNLNTLKLQRHNPEDKLTKIVDFEYDPTAKCPTWEQFIKRVVDNDPDIIDYLQKACGYSISGEVSEEIIIYVYGAGGNGKSVFFNILIEILQDFVIKTPTDMILQKSYEGIGNDLVRMKGTRMVIAAEMPENRNLNEAKLKDLTGGDKITGRKLYEDLIEFKPTHSLWLYGNSKPKIVGTDNGIWRRIVIIPFRVTIPESERIPRHILQRDLLAERQGIFNWLVEGLVKYKTEGLKLPTVLAEEMIEYRAMLDETVSFIADCCIVEKGAECRGSALINAYEEWCNQHGITSVGKKKLYERLSNKGFEKCITRQGHYIFFKGLKIRLDAGIE